MQQDVLIKPDEVGMYDIEIEGSDFKSAGGFESAIPLSLFTDARVEPQTVHDASKRRGWVGNILYVDIDRQLGSTLWVLDQARITQAVINQARIAAKESHQWLIDDGLVLNISVEVITENFRKIEIALTFFNTDNTIDRYIAIWRNTDASQLPTV